MPEIFIFRKSDNKMVYAYSSDTPVEWVDYPFSEFDHVIQDEVLEEPIQNTSTNWKIWVGSFFDRFGDYKIAVLAHPDSIIQAFIKDAMSRRYIDLLERREEISVALDNMISKDLLVDKSKVLDLVPSQEKVWYE